MPDQRISDLTAATALADTDEIELRRGSSNLRADVSLLGGRAALLVAASNASADVIARADYVCDGTADDVQIQAALDALDSDVGGVVELSGGAFTCSAGLTYPAGVSCSLVGAGVPGLPGNSATVLTFTLAATGDCVAFSNDTEAQSLERMDIVGDASNTRYGAYIQGSASFKTMNLVGILDMATTGVRGDSGNSQNYLERVIVRDSVTGFLMFGSSNTYVNCLATGSTLQTGEGFRSQESNGSYFGCTADNYTYGFAARESAVSVTFAGCVSENCEQAIRIHGADLTRPRDITFIGGGHSGVDSATLSGVFVGRSRVVTLINVNIDDTVFGTGFEIHADAEDTNIIGGRSEETTPVNDSGTRTRIRGLRGYITENSGTGTITSGNTSVTITHGLDVTPAAADIAITLTEQGDNDPGNIWVDTITATQFNVNCRANPGASNLDFSWRASVL